MSTRFTACIVAAGRGERAGGGEPKQFRTLAGQPMLRWSIETFSRHSGCEQIVIACEREHAARAAGALLDVINTPAQKYERSGGRKNLVKNAADDLIASA